MNNNPRRYFGKLASLRFFAALLVLLSHIDLSATTNNAFIWFVDQEVFWCGFIGVSIFFVLSGFVISYANDNWKDWKHYMVGRVSRIYPAHLIVTALVILVFEETIRSEKDLIVWLTNFSLLQAWVPSPRFLRALNDVSWSLSVEMFFYVSFIFLRRLEDRYLYMLCISAYCVNLGAEWSMQVGHLHLAHWLFYIFPVSRLPEFLIGMSIYRIYKSGSLSLAFIGKLDFIFLLSLMVATVSLMHILHVKTIFLYFSVPAVFASFMVASLATGGSNGYMQNKRLVLLGESSFALYLIHMPLLMLGLRLVRNVDFPAPMLFMITPALLAIGLAVVFYLKVELPSTRATKKYLGSLLKVSTPA